MKTKLKELTFLKESWLEEKKFMVFQNKKGKLRAVEAHIVQVSLLAMGDKLKAKIRIKDCSGREIETVYL